MPKLNEEQRELVEKNLAFATFVAKKYLSKSDYIKNQDIIQEARIAMIKAVRNYDPNIAKITTYMYPNIDGALKRFVNYTDRIIKIPHQKHLKKATQDKAANAKTVFSLDKELVSNNSNYESYTLLDIIPDNYNMENETINRISINGAIKSLEWKEKLVIIYRYYYDLNQTIIGKMMGISQVHAHRLERKALNKMKSKLL